VIPAFPPTTEISLALGRTASLPEGVAHGLSTIDFPAGPTREVVSCFVMVLEDTLEAEAATLQKLAERVRQLEATR
jgi:hypothetical protein